MLILDSKKKEEKDLIKKSLQILTEGGLVVVPSDTVYGLAADATNYQAIRKLISFKRRPPGKAISVFVENLEKAEEIVTIKKDQRHLLKSLLPGPFTIVLPSKHKLVKDLESEKGTLGIRIPKFDFINTLVKKFGKPITATSANLSGQPPHYSVESFLAGLSQKKRKMIDLIIDFGKLPRNKPSTVVDLSEGKLSILRVGDLNLKNKQKFISKTPEQTKKIGKFLLQKYFFEVDKKPLIFLLEGELGVGKTIFIKGIGEELGIARIISPSFVVYYEYDIKKAPVEKLYHLDLYLTEEEEEFNYLEIDKMLKPKVVICIEWGEKVGEIWKLIKSKGKLIYIQMRYINEKGREIEIISN